MPFSRTGYGNIKGSARFANPSSGRGELIVSFNPCNFENLFLSGLETFLFLFSIFSWQKEEVILWRWKPRQLQSCQDRLHLVLCCLQL